MTNALIKKVINYWSMCSNISTEINRYSIPGIEINNNLSNIYKIDKNISDDIIDIFLNVNHQVVSSKSVEKWNKGWGQNYQDILSNNQIEPFIVPYYYGKYPLSRILGEFILSKSFLIPENLEELLIPKWDIPAKERWHSIEHSLVRLMMQNLVYIPFLEKIIQNRQKEINFYEFGAGTGHNLYFLKKFIDYYLPENNAKYIALDWSKSTGNIVNKLGENFAYNFIDYYDQNSYPVIKENSYIFSLASLEQINISSENILMYIANSNPKLVINIEPISQSLSKNSKLDLQSIKYMKDRNYLPDFISSILKIKMIYHNNIHFEIFRSGIGSQFIDGYTVINWEKR